MKQILLILSLAIMVFSCTKQSCIARSEDGTDLFEVNKSSKCEAQINKAHGEYCVCGK